MEDLTGHIVSAIGGAVVTGVPLGLWAWQKIQGIRATQTEIDNKTARDEYEMDKIRRSDAYQELTKTVIDLRAQMKQEREEADMEVMHLNRKLDAQEAKIAALQGKELDCQTKVAKLEVEIYKQNSIINFLEARLNPTSTVPGTALAETAAEAAAAAAAKIASERIKIHDERGKEQLEMRLREIEELKGEANS
jgi:chromosome segregation ATPase